MAAWTSVHHALWNHHHCPHDALYPATTLKEMELRFFQVSIKPSGAWQFAIHSPYPQLSPHICTHCKLPWESPPFFLLTPLLPVSSIVCFGQSYHNYVFLKSINVANTSFLLLVIMVCPMCQWQDLAPPQYLLLFHHLNPPFLHNQAHCFVQYWHQWDTLKILFPTHSLVSLFGTGTTIHLLHTDGTIPLDQHQLNSSHLSSTNTSLFIFSVVIPSFPAVAYEAPTPLPP